MRLFYLLVAVLSLLQTMQPLLHAHVGGLTHEPRLLHFHGASVVAEQVPVDPGGIEYQSLQQAVASDPPSITVGESFRRHSMLVWTPTPAAPVSAFALLRDAGAPPLAPPGSDRLRVIAARLLPPALAPPSFA